MEKMRKKRKGDLCNSATYLDAAVQSNLGKREGDSLFGQRLAGREMRPGKTLGGVRRANPSNNTSPLNKPQPPAPNSLVKAFSAGTRDRATVGVLLVAHLAVGSHGEAGAVGIVAADGEGLMF